MASIPPFLLKYGVTLTKALWALWTGDHKALTETALKGGDAWLNDKAKPSGHAPAIQTILDKVLTTLADLPNWEGAEDERLAAASEAVETLAIGFTFESLAENLNTLERLPALWSTYRRFPIDTRVRELHDRLLLETAKALVPVLNDLPGFRSWLIGYTARKFNTLIARAEEHVAADKALSATLVTLLGQEGLRDADFEQKYRNALTRHLDRVELFIDRQDVPMESREQELTVAYVTLELTRGRSAQQGQSGLSADVLLDNLPDGPPRVLIVGPAGSGKTTLLRWIGLEAARFQPNVTTGTTYAEPSRFAKTDVSAFRWREHIPFLVRLRDWPVGDFPTPMKLHLGAKCPADVPDGWAERILGAGRGLLLLDGLDELTPGRRREALEWIRELTAAYPPGNAFVASSRPQGLPSGALNNAKFIEYEVQELSPTGRVEFVEKWHEAVKRRYPDAPDVWEQLEAKQRRLLLELESNWSLALLASNPLLCSLICALNRVYTQSLPENLHDLCDSACRMLLWDREQLAGMASQSAPPEYVALNYRMRLLVARNLAYIIAKDSGSTLKRSSAVEEVATALHGAADPDYAEAEAVLKGLIERSNLLRACGEDEVEFVHNALRDYLASLRFVLKNEDAFLVQKIDAGELDRWEPVCLLAAATTSETFGIVFLRTILNLNGHDQDPTSSLNKFSNKIRHRRELVALKVARQVQFRLPYAVTARLRAIQEKMLPVDSVSKAEILAEAGEPAIEYLEYKENRKVDVAVACIHGLRRIGTEKAKASLQDYLRKDQRPDLLEEQARFFSPKEMATAVNVLSIPSIQKAIQTSSGAPLPYRPYIRDLSLLSTASGIQSLYLNGTQVKDLSHLSKISGLRELFLSNTPIIDLSMLSGLTGLLMLNLNDTQVSDLSPLARLSALQVLSIDDTQVRDLSSLSKLNALKQVSLDNTPVKDLSPLSATYGLQTLYIRNTQVDDLSPLSALAWLQWLYINGTQVSDLSPLIRLSGLRILSVTNATLEPDAISSFERSRKSDGMESVEILRS